MDETADNKQRRTRPGTNQPALQVRTRPRRQLLRHVASLLPRQKRRKPRHRTRSQRIQTQRLLHRHQTLQLLTLAVQLRGRQGHIRAQPEVHEDRLHRLPPPPQHRRRRHAARTPAIPRQRTPRLAHGTARGRTHPQPRILLPRRRGRLRLGTGTPRPVPLGLRADTGQLRRLEQRTGQGTLRQVPLRGTRKEEHTRRHHGTAARRTPLEGARPRRSTLQTAQTREQRGIMGLPLHRLQARSAHRAERHDIHGAPRGQPAHIRTPRTPHRRGTAVARKRDGNPHQELPHHRLQRLQVLHAMPLRTRHPGHLRTL